MALVEVREVAEGYAGQHTTAAVMACLLSLGMHAIALYGLSRFQLDVPFWRGRLHRPRPPEPMRFVHVKAEVGSQRGRPGKLRPGDSSFTMNLVKEAEVLGVKPDVAVIEPPPLTGHRLAGETRNIAGPSAAPKRLPWQPRQEIVAIENEIVADEVSASERRRISRIERVSAAPDIVVPVDSGTVGNAGISAAEQFSGGKPEQAEIAQKTDGGVRAEKFAPLIEELRTKVGSELFEKDVTEITAFKPVEKVLVAEISTYTTLKDLKHGYFKIEIKRAGAEILPVIPKDVILVQDCSASMAEQRLHFCRDGLIRCLSEIGPEDRFNIVGFRDCSAMCFEDWSKNEPQAIERSKRFIEGMKSIGNTDIFLSVKDLMNLKRTPGRPIITFLVTDGHPTTGLIKSSDIVGEFSKLNDGAISVFTMGTVQTANSYLLDLLSYCNRGDSLIITKGRWDISDSIQRIMQEIKRPVLADLRFRFAESARCEVYPVLTSNLYLDRPLSLYGRYARGTKNIVFQAVGKGGHVDCDMVFDLDLDKVAKVGDKDIRKSWARQKIYHLIGGYARKAEPEILKEIRDTSKAYKVEIPHRGEF